QHAKRGVASLSVVPDLEVFEDRVGQLDAPVLMRVKPVGTVSAALVVPSRLVPGLAGPSSR
ncbi:MAG: hypothetical protein OXH86_18395, partial [Acidimicrobiaceae bacterium]|nr:hypothetical protein [Acidimicrobiaceae bacterium]